MSGKLSEQKASTQGLRWPIGLEESRRVVYRPLRMK
jgi:hypothetical protein